jgi:hypothetical protein
VIGIREHGARRGAGPATLLCALGLGAGLGLLAASSAAAAVSTRPAANALHAPAATPRHVKLVQPLGARRSFTVGAQRRPGKTITARSVRGVPHSPPR